MTKHTFLLTALKTGVPFGLFMGLFYAGRGGGAIAMGIANGIAFGLAMAGFMAWQHKRSARVRAPYEAEGIVHHGPANYGAGANKIGGWLVLTKTRLVFEPHKLNLGGRRVEIARSDILAVVPGEGLVPNKVDVVLQSNQTHRFIVSERPRWLAQLPRAMT